jgi:2',3'-cyclic-nucleotide 2'-phosphodiesterase
VLGTHTHVATADASLLRRQTAFLCDVGMTGPHESVLGREIEPVVSRFLDGMPRRFEVATGDNRLSGAIVAFNSSGRAEKIEWISARM